MEYFTIFQDKLHSFNIQNRTKLAWAFSKTVQKISKITYTASRFSLLTSAKFSVHIKRVTLQHNKEFIVFIFFLFNGFITMCNLRPRPHVSGDFCIRKFFYADTKISASTRSVNELYTTVHTYPIRIRTSQRISQQSMRTITKKAEPAIILAPNSRLSCLFT